MMRQTQKRCRLKQRHDQQSCATGAGRVGGIEVTIIDGIAERIGAIRYEGLPAEAVRWAKAAILDTVGVTLAGAAEPCARIAAGVLGLGQSGGECLIFGSGQRATALDAALINGTAAHALDFDDVSNSLGGHPSAPILPAIFALGEILDSTGREFIAAYVAGFETETRIGRGVNLHHYEKGWHPTATLGVFGAAACCHLMGLDRAKPRRRWRSRPRSRPASRPI